MTVEKLGQMPACRGSLRECEVTAQTESVDSSIQKPGVKRQPEEGWA